VSDLHSCNDISRLAGTNWGAIVAGLTPEFTLVAILRHARSHYPVTKLALAESFSAAIDVGLQMKFGLECQLAARPVG
jgi:hypothetical protein